METIKKDIDDLIKGFNSLTSYKTFCGIKDSINTDEEYLRLKKELKDNKAMIKSLASNHKLLQEHLIKTKELEEEFLSHPLNINLQVYKEALLELVDPLFDIFN